MTSSNSVLGGQVACGNNKISREALHAAPAPTGYVQPDLTVRRDPAMARQVVEASKHTLSEVDRKLRVAASAEKVAELLQFAEQAADAARRSGSDKSSVRALERKLES